MTCTACYRTNLPGGVRCSYCGVSLPPALDFEVDSGAAPAPSPAAHYPETDKRTGRAAGTAGLLVLLLLKGKSLLSLLKFGKIATTLSSMVVFIWADAVLFGWKFGVGIALCILIHELGHVFVNWRKGIPQSAPMFIPFVGAVIFVKRFPDDPTVQAESGAGGPAAGLLAALVCLGIGKATGIAYWVALAHVGFVINLFNLIPFPPLDGSHISSVFSPRVWSAILIAMLLWALKAPSPMLWMVLIIGFLFRLGKNDNGRHQLARPAARIRMAAVYLVLCLGLAYGADHTTVSRGALITGETAVTSAHRQENTALREPQTARAEQGSIAPETEARIRWVMRIAIFGGAALIWSLTSFLLYRAARRRVTFGFLTLPAGMLAVLTGITILGRTDLLSIATAWVMLGAYFAAGLAAFVFAGYRAVRRDDPDLRGLMPLTARALAWSVGGALVVAYADENLAVAVAVLVCAGIFYGLRPWLAASLAGTLYAAAGEHEHALNLRHRALRLRPDPESAALLWKAIALEYVALARGSDAVEAYEKQLAAGLREVTIDDIRQQAIALSLSGRYEDSVGLVERVLRAPSGEQGDARLLAAHWILAEIARHRDWPDESLAQTDWCLRALSPKAHAPVARLRAIRSAALASMGEVDAARSDADLAVRASREPEVELLASCALAQAAITVGEPPDALREAGRAERALPGNLEAAYWRGRALLAAGRLAEGEEILSRLAARFPSDRFGRLAAECLSAPHPETSAPAAALP